MPNIDFDTYYEVIIYSISANRKLLTLSLTQLRKNQPRPVKAGADVVTRSEF